MKSLFASHTVEDLLPESQNRLVVFNLVSASELLVGPLKM